ncbi:MAG: universal stress protein [Actinomycetota bacterium]
MFRHLLLAYDGSKEGACALRQGAELAQALGAAVTLLAVVPAPAGMLIAEAVGPEDLRGREEALHREVLDFGLGRLAARGLVAEGRIAYGVPVDEIAACAREVGADLIVLGHRRRGRLARWWSGSVDVSLLSRAPCSVLVAVEEEG